jgi:uncharacterized membrane protein YphA (DoxX/SURF4 family)
MTEKTKGIIVELISILFIILFVYAAVSKWIDFDKFKVQLSQSPIINPFATLVIWLVPIVELILAILLIVPKWQNLGLYGSFSLMVAFSAYIVAITHFSEYIPCSCGGILEHMSWNTHLLFNMGFVMLASAAILIKPVETHIILRR